LRRVRAKASLEIGRRRRVAVDRDVVEPARPGGVASPRVERDEEVEAEAEAGLEDDEALARGPATRQVVAAEKDVPRLSGTGARSVVDVAVARVERRAVLAQLDRRRFDRRAAQRATSR